jgi:putative membrane protein
MLTDLFLAVAHHILVFSLAGLLAAETFLVRGELGGTRLALLAALDRFYGLTAGLVIVVGIGRVFLSLKGWEYYVHNTSFWLKMAAIAAVGIASAPPTRRILGWAKRASADPQFVVPADEISATQTFLKVQIGVFALILFFAAAMARGFGS